MTQTVSVIVPTLNEEDGIDSFLRHVSGLAPDLEIIVVDGGSSDATVVKASERATVLHGPRGRGAQMNAGAREAEGEILWFLHADCFPHPDSVAAMEDALSEVAVVGGGFEYDLDHPGFFFRLTESVSNRKNRAFGLLFGDMGIFVRRSVFETMGGYREFPLMEDMDFCERLKHEGDIAIIPLRIKTSARRWLDEGIVKNLVRNWILQAGWKCGVSPNRLAKWYSFGNGYGKGHRGND